MINSMIVIRLLYLTYVYVYVYVYVNHNTYVHILLPTYNTHMVT